MRKTIYLFLSVILLLSTLGICAYAEDAVAEKWHKEGVILGDKCGNLELDTQLTRAQLVAMINRMFDIKNVTRPMYDDINSGLWYYDDVVAAVQHGYLKDTGNFYADELITWIETLDIIVRATGIAAPVNKRDIAIAARKADENSAYAVAVLDKRDICKRNSYSEIITKREALYVLGGVYTQLFSGTQKTIDFSQTQRKYVNDDFEWDAVDGFPANWYCQADKFVSVKNVNENNYVSINKGQTDGSAEMIKYFPPAANKLSFEASVMSEELSGEKIGPDLRTSVYRDNTSVIKMRMNNGAFYTTDGGTSVKLLEFEASRWYKIRLDIDLDEGVYDVYIDDNLLRAGCSVNMDIFSGHIGQVHFGFENGKAGTFGFDNV